MVCCVLCRHFDTATRCFISPCRAGTATVVGILLKSASIACFPEVWLTRNGQLRLVLDASTFGGRTEAWIEYAFATVHHGVEQLYLKCKSSNELADGGFVDLVSVRIIGWTRTPRFRSVALPIRSTATPVRSTATSARSVATPRMLDVSTTDGNMS